VNSEQESMSGEPEGAKEAYGPFHRSLITVHCTLLHPRYPIVMRRAILTQPLGIIIRGGFGAGGHRGEGWGALWHQENPGKRALMAPFVDPDNATYRVNDGGPYEVFT
jgi:hypothetical protein